MSVQTSAYAAETPGALLTPTSVTRRDLRPNDVHIDIKYCGVCHTDVHQVGEEWGQASFPMVPGHEITGIVSAVGSDVTKYQLGDRVGVGCFVDSCRDCPSCKEGQEQYCEVGMVMTYNAKGFDGEENYGGYSTGIVVDADYVLSIPDSLDLDVAAPLLCAGITVYDPMMNWSVGQGKRVAVVGLGGLGHMAVKLGKALGAEVTVLTHSPQKIEDARQLGADWAYDTNDTAIFTKLQRSFDLIINTVSVNLDIDAYINLLDISGSLVTVAVPTQPTTVGPFSLLVNRRSMAGSQIGGIAKTQEMLDFCGANQIGAEIELVPIQDINEAFARMVRSDVRYRFVIDMASLEGQS